MGDVARKVMGDVPIAFVEGAGGTRVSEDEIVAVGKHDVCSPLIYHQISFQVVVMINLFHRYSHSRSVGRTAARIQLYTSQYQNSKHYVHFRADPVSNRLGPFLHECQEELASHIYMYSNAIILPCLVHLLSQ